MKPTFIGLGAQKCASTWIHRVLKTHPQVRLPDVKEIDFFSHYFDYGYQWYERQFEGHVDGHSDAQGTGSTCTGEISPSYFHDMRAPARVKAYCPEVKLLVTLRDPVERAYSNHKHEVRLGHLRGDDLSFEAGLANNPMYVEQGLYGKHLANWLRHFPREQIYVALVDAIRDDPAGVAREVFGFLGIDDSFRSPALDMRFNTSFANRFHSLVRLKDGLYRVSHIRGMEWLWSAAAGMGARSMYRRLNVVDSDVVIPPPRGDTVHELRETFAADVRELESLLDRSLSHWLCGEEVEHNGSRLSGGIA